MCQRRDTISGDKDGIVSDSPPGTLPMNISTTGARPDVVLIDNCAVRLPEVTVPTNTIERLSKPPGSGN